MIIDKNYPFKSVKIFVNNKCFDNILKQNIYLIDLNKELSYPDCFCCTSLTCCNNWNPKVSLIDLEKEITHVLTCKLNILHIYYCRKLALQYLVQDISIEKYL